MWMGTNKNSPWVWILELDIRITRHRMENIKAYYIWKEKGKYMRGNRTT